jgi:predicted nucleic acid-binding protein
MDAVVIDTDVLSYLFKQDTRGELYQPHLDGKLGVLSFMTIAELEFWADSRNWGARRRAKLAAFLQPYTVIHSDRDLCRKWAEIRNQVMRSGHHIDTADCWIAATAMLYGIPLITHNQDHFIHVNGLIVISEATT